VFFVSGELPVLPGLLIWQLRERHIVQVVLDLLHLQQEDVLVAVERYHVIVNFRSNPVMIIGVMC